MVQRWTRQPRSNPLLGRAALVGILVLLLLAFLAPAQEFVKRSLVSPGDAKPISLNADAIATWVEGGQRIFLLRKNVWIEQGLIKISMPEAVVWVDEARQRSSGIYQLLVYGEGTVDLREGSQQTTAGRVLVDLATRGELSIKARAKKLVQEALVQDPVYVRAQREKQVAEESPAAAPEESAMNDRLTGDRNRQDRNPILQAEASALRSLPAPPPPAATAWVRPPGNLPAMADPPSLPPPALQRTNYQATPVPEIGSSPAVQPVAFPQPAAPPPQTIREVPPPPVPIPGASPGAPRPPPPGGPIPVPKDASGQDRLRQLNARPRSGQALQIKSDVLPNGETVIVVTNGVILSVSNASDKVKLVDIEADRMVFWTKSNSQELLENLQGAGETKSSRTMEFYLSGNVEMRNESKKDGNTETQILRADEVYYDVSKNLALALKADMEFQQPQLPYPLHVEADELWQLGPKLFKAGQSELFASDLPSDPGLKVVVSETTLEETDSTRRNVFGFPFKDPVSGEVIKDPLRIFRGRNLVVRLDDIPIFYFPYVQGDAADPLGPLENINFNYNKIFGFQFFSTWNVYDLLGFRPVPGTRWRLTADYLSLRGPALGTEYNYLGQPLFGWSGRNETLVKAYGILDNGDDRLGGNPNRGQFNVVQLFPPPPIILPMTHPYARGRFLARTNVQDLPNGFTYQQQISVLSDKNFLEQFFNYEFNNDINQETFAYLKQQQGIWAWNLLLEPKIRNWVTETWREPDAHGYLLGQKFFDLVTYNAHGGAGFLRLIPTHQPPPAYLPTDKFINSGRFDFWQDASIPFNLGAFKLAPYAVLDLTYYTEDINKNDIGRVLGGGGARASLPFSRLFPDVQSDFFNVNGIFHKIVFSGNYYNVFSNVNLEQLAQLDRLNDDASDQALRDIRPRQPLLNPANALNLMNANEFNPQFYYLRRLGDNRVDSLQAIEVFQFDIRQRWQTKRGFPGNQHIIDWMTLDVGASVFPRANRDNFGETFGILYYDWGWNIGDSTSLVSSGWMDPIADGPRVFTVGANLSRPDRTNLYLGYRELDPLNSKAVLANLTYALSAKYALTGSTFYDFGVKTQVNMIALSRIGTDLTVSLGISYNSILNTAGVNFMVMPNLFMRGGGAAGPAGPLGMGGLGSLNQGGQGRGMR